MNLPLCEAQVWRFKIILTSLNTVSASLYWDLIHKFYYSMELKSYLMPYFLVEFRKFGFFYPNESILILNGWVVELFKSFRMVFKFPKFPFMGGKSTVWSEHLTINSTYCAPLLSTMTSFFSTSPIISTFALYSQINGILNPDWIFIPFIFTSGIFSWF